METHSLLTNLLSLNIKSVISSFEKNNVTIEFPDKDSLERSVAEISDLIGQNIYTYKLYLNIFALDYTIDIQTRKVLFSRCFLRGIHSIKDTCFGIYYNMHVKKLNSISEFVDLNSTSIGLSWIGSQIFSEDNFYGITYGLPQRTSLLDLDLQNFFSSVGIGDYLNNKLDKFSLNYVTFNVANLNTVACVFSSDEISKYCQNYVNIADVMQYFELYGDGMSVEYNVEQSRINSIETGILTRNEFIDHVNYIISANIFNENLVKNLREIYLPEYVDGILLKFVWETDDNIDLQVRVYIEDHSHIKQTLSKLAHTA